MKKWFKIILMGLLIVTLVMVGVYQLYRYTAREKVEADNIHPTSYGWFVDAKAEQASLVFYQGALVDAAAYLPLAEELASAGFDVYLMDSLFDLPIFNFKGAEKLIKQEKITSVVLMGHSLGGVVASQVADQLSSVKGLVLLASYPAKGTDLSDNDLAVLSFLGDQDRVVNRENFKEAQSRLPKENQLIMIEGGNHSQFGDYGLQKKDGMATINKEVQWQKVVEAVSGQFLKR